MGKSYKKISDPTKPSYQQAALFPSSPEPVRYNPYPALYQGAKANEKHFRLVLEQAVAEGLIGCDLEFNDTRPTIIGIASRSSALAVRWNEDLARLVISESQRVGANIVGHSTIGAEKQELEKALGIKTPASMYDCSMIAHHLVNADMTKLAGKDENEEAGSLGLMGLWTVASLYTDLPMWKDHRDRWCEGPCPKCIRGESLVWLADGTKARIAKLVKDEYAGEVLCVDSQGRITSAKVNAWYRNARNNRQFVRVTYEHVIGKSSHKQGTVMTADHPVLTAEGYKAAGQLTCADKINTGTPAPSRHQEKFIAGLLLGDSHIKEKGTLSITHGIAQVEYLRHKARLLSTWGGNELTHPPRLTSKGHHTWTIYLSPYWKYVAQRFKKDWENFLLEHFTLQSLAIWYMDDGSYHRYQSLIAVKSYSETEREWLTQLIKTKTGIDCYVRGEAIVFPAESAKTLAEVIAAYVPPCLRYKLYPLRNLAEFDHTLYEPAWNGEAFYSPARVYAAAGRINHRNGHECDDTVFCLGVDKYENFLTEAGVVHNCSVFDYCAVDSWASLAAFYKLRDEMKTLNIPHDFYRNRVDLTDICVRMEKNGLRIDRAWVGEMEKRGNTYKDKLFPFEIVNGKTVYTQFNPKSRAQILSYCKAHGISLEDTTKKDIAKSLESAARKEGVTAPDIDKLCTALETAPELSENLTTLLKLYQYKNSGKGVKSWFNETYFGKDGRVHPRFVTTGASTGRLSSSKPNFQNVPNKGWGEDIKKAIIPEEGCDFLESDFSQLELRTILHLCGVDMKDIGKDAFVWLVENSNGQFAKAAVALNMTERDVAKSLTHGTNYLEGIQVLSPADLAKPNIKAEVEYGARVIYQKKYKPQLSRDWDYCGGVVSFTGSNLAERLFGDKTLANRKKAISILEDIYFNAFWCIREWQMRTSEQAEKGYFQSPVGRYLRVYGSPEENAKIGCAFLGSGVGADHVQGIMLRFDRELGQIPAMQVHDSLVFNIPKEWSNEKAKEFISLMQQESGVVPGFRCPGKIKRGPTYGDIRQI